MALITMTYLSKKLGRHVNVKVLLPYDIVHAELMTGPPYRTLYFLPGYTGNAEKIYSSIGLAQASMMNGTAIVIPDGENSFYVDDPVRKAFYSKFIVEELVEVTRTLYPLSCRYEDTWIGGVSMGGYAAIMLAYKYPGVFSKIAALSPACDIYNVIRSFNGTSDMTIEMMDSIFGSEETYLTEYEPVTLRMRLQKEGKPIPELFISCGTKDPIAYEADRRLSCALNKNDVRHYFDEEEGGHDSVFWNKAIGKAMLFLTDKDGKQHFDEV